MRPASVGGFRVADYGTRKFGPTNLTAGCLVVCGVGSYLFFPHNELGLCATHWKGEMTAPLKKKDIGNAARKARVALGLTQEDAAEEIGVTVEFYSRIERGTSLPSLKTLVSMAMAFRVSTDKLLGLTEDEQAERLLREFAARQQRKDPPELRRLFRRLRHTAMDKVRFVTLMLHELEKMFGESVGDVMSRSLRGKKSPEDEDDDYDD